MIAPFAKDDWVTVWSMGSPKELRSVAKAGELVTLDDDSVWFADGSPIEDKHLGCTIAHTRPGDFDKIDEARSVGRIKELMSWLVSDDRLYRLTPMTQTSLERVMMSCVAEALRSQSYVGEVTITRQLASIKQNLSRAEEVELQGLARAGKFAISKSKGAL